ncbi:helix-turn-helix transcriptional regulator [Streptomyces xinghaiensis]
MPGATDLDADHESAYRTLVGLGGAEPAELAARLTLPEEEAARILRRLERHGLAVRSPARPGRWLAAGTAWPDGTGAPRQRRPVPEAGDPAPGRTRQTADPAGRPGPEGHPAGTPAAGAGGAREGAGADSARPAVQGTTDGPDAVDLRILSLLLAGLTDASAAKQLDLGLRTVQRRVKRLMEIAGVSTRLQLGWHACEHGWPARTPTGRTAAGSGHGSRTGAGAGAVSGTLTGTGARAGAAAVRRAADEEPLPGHPPPVADR